jgi:hypothetical protein
MSMKQAHIVGPIDAAVQSSRRKPFRRRRDSRLRMEM